VIYNLLAIDRRITSEIYVSQAARWRGSFMAQHLFVAWGASDAAIPWLSSQGT
jgi:hypothetical protein